MNILYVGDGSESSTSYHRLDALRRIGNHVYQLDPLPIVRQYARVPIIGRIHYHTGYSYIQKKLTSWLYNQLHNFNSIELIWINGGEWFGPSCLQALKKLDCPILLYNNDDPTGHRDGNME